MEKRVYFMTCSDAALSKADRILRDLGADIVYIGHGCKQPSEVTDGVPVLVVVADDDVFTCKHIRLDPSYGGRMSDVALAIPQKIHQYLTREGIQTVFIKRKTCENVQRLAVPLTNMHYRDFKTGQWIGPKSRRSRLARMMDRVRDRRAKYAFS